MFTPVIHGWLHEIHIELFSAENFTHAGVNTFVLVLYNHPPTKICHSTYKVIHTNDFSIKCISVNKHLIRTVIPSFIPG